MVRTGGVGARGIDGAVDRLGAGSWQRSAVVPSVRAAAAAAPKPGAEAAAPTLPRPAAAPPLTRYATPVRSRHSFPLSPRQVDFRRVLRVLRFLLLSAKIDVLWLDFDIYLFRDPIAHIKSLLPDKEKHGLLDAEVKEKRGIPFAYDGVVESRAPDEKIWG